jgi:hypothetical protein
LACPFGDPRFRAASVEIFKKHGCRADPEPPEFWYSLDASLNNTNVHHAMLYVSMFASIVPRLTAFRPAIGKTALYAIGLSRIASTRSTFPRW